MVRLAAVFFLLSSICLAQKPQEAVLLSGIPGEMASIAESTFSGSFTTIDEFIYMEEIPVSSTIEDAAGQISNYFEDDMSKVRSIYSWIALHLSYDSAAIWRQLIPDQGAEAVFAIRKGVCEGYANLFSAMCNSIGIESRLIIGYVNDESGRQQKFPNHVWNSVKINGKWQLVDVTWASLHCSNENFETNPDGNSEITRYLNQYFLADPQLMILTHLPEDPYWQLQSNFISLQEFWEGPEIISEVLNDTERTPHINFENLIAELDQLDSLDRTIAYLERMENNPWNNAKEYGLGVACYFKAQKLLTYSNKKRGTYAGHIKELARSYYEKSIRYLSLLGENDVEYEFSRVLSENVSFRLETIQ